MCSNCDKTGHISRNCPSRAKNNTNNEKSAGGNTTQDKGKKDSKSK